MLSTVLWQKISASYPNSTQATKLSAFVFSGIMVVRGLIAAVPVYVVLADLWYGLLLNISQSLHEPSKHAPNIVPTVPDVAFNWLQVLANAGMVLVMAFALWQLLQLNKAVVRKQVWHMSAFRILGLVLTLAFSLPALYGFAMAILSLLQGHLTIAFGNLRYLVTALCMAYCAMLCLWRLLAWRRSRKGLTTDTPDAHASTELLRSGDSKHP